MVIQSPALNIIRVSKNEIECVNGKLDDAVLFWSVTGSISQERILLLFTRHHIMSVCLSITKRNVKE